MTSPNFTEELVLWARGRRRIAGVDEAGRGPLAGPVVAAAVVLPMGFSSDWTHLVADSKLLTAPRRELLFDRLCEAAVAWGTGVVDSYTIDALGIAKATRLAMKAAIDQIQPAPDYLLIDYFRLPEAKLPQKGVPDGDTICFSIASASIIAKVTRDRLMCELDGIYPGYGFAAHKGYATRRHLDCLRRLGPCAIHRRSFAPVREAFGL